MARKTAATRKAEIVATTLRLADELGPDRLTTQAVADVVGLTQPGVFRHFPTKQVLWQAVAETIDATMTEAWETALAGSPAPLDRLALLIRTQLRQIEGNPAIPAILHSRELQTENTDLRDRFRSLMMRFQALLRAELIAARDAGQIRGDIDADDGAVLLISLVQGLAIRWALGNRSFPLEAEGARLVGSQMRLFRTDAAKEIRT
ncbi:TetR/AcrR family transcriptional regulator [Ruegeria sp. 1NDH52C]|uniref:TetR/AcrR family transcriptional regulator n=1 Tax=Ruegeria alba TaxID=2916756 RepID=A0ABS9P262_9RHOB|nr:TetR/AcrR family transcriptional regulator [Ruegeria alba]MCE8521354.1 TetR/AcrR family transcriptional regulator [Ruegeria pomeroyi]MCG6560577.1 TetR/AcrR family transcriptional regulator [Ruegeria alba]